jgi:hypothetical protein
MRHNRTGEHSNEHGGYQHKPDILRFQSALAQQRRDKRPLHTERVVEQGVCGQKTPKNRRSGHIYGVYSCIGGPETALCWGAS